MGRKNKMSLTAREWLLLPVKEQQERGAELSAHECFLLRTELGMLHFSEEEKARMSDAEKEVTKLWKSNNIVL